MNKTAWLKIINTIMFFVLLWQIISGVMSHYGFAGAASMVVYNSHYFTGIAIVIFATTHLILNWGWVKNNIFGIKTNSPQK